MFKKWIRNLIIRCDINAINFVRMPADEEYSAIVHQGNLYLARNSMLWMCGPCGKVIDAVYAANVLARVEEPMATEDEDDR